MQMCALIDTTLLCAIFLPENGLLFVFAAQKHMCVYVYVRKDEVTKWNLK